MTMLDREAVVLAVIDFQERLLPKILNAEAITEQAVKLIRFTRQIDLPILWTEQYPKGLGPTVEPIARELPGLRPLEKVSFGCLGDRGFLEALRGTSRQQLLITGIEAHVCILQTALGAREQGYEVFVVRDATGSRADTDYQAALARMVESGVQLVTAEMAIFEILRVAGTPEFKKTLPLVKQ